MGCNIMIARDSHLLKSYSLLDASIQGVCRARPRSIPAGDRRIVGKHYVLGLRLIDSVRWVVLLNQGGCCIVHVVHAWVDACVLKFGNRRIRTHYKTRGVATLPED